MPPPFADRLAWSVSTLGCPDLDLDAAAALARRHGIGALELRCVEGRMDLPDLLAARFGDPAAFARRLAQLGVRVPVFDTSYRLIGAGPGDLEALAAFAPWADAAGCRWLRAFDGGARAPGLADETADALRRGLDRWRERRAAGGWACNVAVETHDALAHPDAARAFLALPEPPALLWDSHHTWTSSGEDPVATWRDLRPHVVHVHVKDSEPGLDGARRYVPPGRGGFPLAALLAVLADEAPGTSVGLEWERRWHPDLPPLDEALAALGALGA